MATITFPRIIISGTSSGVGKSLITMGIASALMQRRISVNVCMHGVRLPQAVLYRRITLRYPRILDPQLLSPLQMLESIRHAGIGADIVIIDGNHGLYDGRSPGNWEGADAELAELLACPTVMVFDAGLFGASAGALVKGFAEAAGQRFFVDGAIANWLDPENLSNRNRLFYDVALSSFGCPPLVGAVPVIADAGLESNQLPVFGIAQDRNRTLLGRSFILDVTKTIGESVNLEHIVDIANRAPHLKVDEGINPGSWRCRVAVSDDSCFNLGFSDNLDLLKCHGAELVPFSPLADRELPRRVGGLYLTGAYLSEYGADLAANQDMRMAILDFVKQGGVVYAEGGGAAFLCSEFQVGEGGATLPGVGVLAGRAVQRRRSVDYVAVEVIEESIVGKPGMVVRGVDSFEWDYETMLDPPLCALKFLEPAKRRAFEGFSPYAEVVATFAFLHWGSNAQVAKQFVDAAEVAGRRFHGTMGYSGEFGGKRS